MPANDRLTILRITSRRRLRSVGSSDFDAANVELAGDQVMEIATTVVNTSNGVNPQSTKPSC